MVRGALLLAIAVVLGVVLLNTFDDGTDPFAQNLVASGTTTTTTTEAAPAATTTTTVDGAGAARAGRRQGAARQRHEREPVRRARRRRAEEVGLQRAVRGRLHDARASPRRVVYSTPGYEAEAADVAAKLGLPPTAVQAGAPPIKPDELRGANVIVVAGADLTSRIS